MTQDNSSHSKTIVAFLDILGYDFIVRKMIDDSEFIKQFDDLMYGISIEMLEKFKNLSISAITQDKTIDDEYFKKVVDAIKIRLVFDNIIFSLPLSDIEFSSDEYNEQATVNNCIETFFSLISMFSTFFIGKMGALLRGGISIGSHYESEKDNYLMIFSEAHNKAVRLESKANYPRIILEKSLLTHLEESSYSHIDKFFYKDIDEQYCFDIYSALHVIGDTQKNVLMDINKGLTLNMKNNLGNNKELSKLIYFAEYHNKQVNSDTLNFPELAINVTKFEKFLKEKN